ncbi:unnamed protein product [Blepharisma stoltei]|uniref:Receptor ligand binding region domain-containing protein n=1 Tax=Blepharisma stoltei TaxID=1481888 RepID=A0AAU9I8I9_9CILI|nr:unnamed protein product [Blepharisma stoltei]
MWTQAVAILAILSQCFGQLLAEIIYSSHTDAILIASISSAINQKFFLKVEINEVFINTDLNIENLSEESDIIFDLSESASISEIIKDFTKKHQIILVSIQNPANSYTDWQYFTHPTNLENLMALSSILSFLNWEKFIIIFDENTIDYLKDFKDQFLLKQLVPFFFSNKETQTFSDNFIGKVVKSTGIRNIAILNQWKSASKLVKSLRNKNMMKEGIGIILGSWSWWDVNENGILGYTESGLENATGYYSYEALACVKLMDLILTFPSSSNNLELIDYLEQNTINHHPIPSFTIMNSYNNEKRRVGAMADGAIIWNDDLIFVGNSSSIPNSPTTPINIWIADGKTNPGFANSELPYSIKAGARYALLSYKQKTHFLDGFDIVLTHTDCGAEVYEPAFSLKCFSELKGNPGIVFMTTPLPTTLFGNLISMKALNITMPVISEYATPQALESKTNYPQFMRIAGYDLYHTSVLTTLINVFGWKNIVLILENSTDNIAIHDYIVNWAEEFKINIANKEEDRWIMLSYNHTRFDTVKDWMKRIIDLKVRPMLFYVTPPFEYNAIVDFYEAGLRQGNCIFLLTNRVAFVQTKVNGDVAKQRLRELLYGALIIMEAEYIGEYGQEILKELQEYYYPLFYSDWKCLSFDAAMLILNGLKYTLAQGDDYEDNSVFNANLRLQKFLSCSGTVSIESDSNNRNSATLGIYNMRWNESTGLIYESLTGTYSVGSKQLFTFFDNIIWFSNKTTLPDDKIVYDNGCPFDKSEIRFSAKGAAIFYSSSSFIFIVAIIISFYVWKKRWHAKDPEPIKKSRIQFEDYIAMIAVFIDFFQFLSLGPDFSYDVISTKVSSWVSINIGWLNKGEKLWIYANCAVVIVALWVFFSIQIAFNLFEKSDNTFSSTIRAMSKLSLTIIGNLGFLPLISVFLSSFACYESIGPNIKQTFVHQDCSTFCWQDKHIIWATLSIISLLIYLPSAIYFRPFVDTMSNGNIKSKPLFMMAKGVLQVSAIILSKTLKVYYAGLHGLIYILLVSIFTAFCIKLKPYNYGRVNLWLIMSYLAVIWSVSLSSISSISSYQSIPLWLTADFIGWALLTFTGLYIQAWYCPSMLFTEENGDIGVLFRFQLGKSINADKINQIIRERKFESARFSSNFLNLSDRTQNNFIVDKGKDCKKGEVLPFKLSYH